MGWNVRALVHAPPCISWYFPACRGQTQQVQVAPTYGDTRATTISTCEQTKPAPSVFVRWSSHHLDKPLPLGGVPCSCRLRCSNISRSAHLAWNNRSQLGHATVPTWWGFRDSEQTSQDLSNITRSEHIALRDSSSFPKGHGRELSDQSGTVFDFSFREGAFTSTNGLLYPRRKICHKFMRNPLGWATVGAGSSLARR